LVLIGISTACVLVGVVQAIDALWVTDDAYISFRYARNLVEGLGLVFNAGERVEGFSNFLWTLWSALAIRIGIDPVHWSLIWGVVFYAASIALLAFNHMRLRRAWTVTAVSLPVGAIVAALHGEWFRYATGGLETSAFAFLALLGFVMLTGENAPGRDRLLVGGIILGLASLTRPDGLIFAAVAAAWVVAVAYRSVGSRTRAGAWFVVGFVAVWLPFMIWRLVYYGDLFPNPYYAKSAYLSWFAQGRHYVSLFFIKYWILLAAVPLVTIAASRLRHGDPPEAGRRMWTRQAILAGGFVLAYTLYVARVGGDFMFGRFLVPTVPFWAVLLDLGTMALLPRRALHVGATAVVVIALLVTPTPIPGRQIVNGIADEPRHYSRDLVEEVNRKAEVLKRFFEGLDVTVAFTGSEARLVYLADVPRAIECETGLTDRTIARQELERRGRPGHEKHAKLEYVVDVRKAHFVLNAYAWRIIGAEGRVPQVPVELDGVRAFPLHWDPELMSELENRGAQFQDFPTLLDRIIVNLDRLDPARVAALYADLKRFYFDHVEDPERRAAFERRVR
jgi:hypothetical protein